MIDNSVLKRLAIQCGIDPMFNQDEQLQAFSQAVIENYKASLVPVAYFLHESYDGTDEYNQTDPTVKIAIPLYELPTSSKNELPIGETK